MEHDEQKNPVVAIIEGLLPSQLQLHGGDTENWQKRFCAHEARFLSAKRSGSGTFSTVLWDEKDKQSYQQIYKLNLRE